MEKGYDDVANSYDRFYRKNLFKVENDILFTQEITEQYYSGKVLDIGCGTGFLLDNIIIPKRDYLGIDISQGMLEKAKQKYPDYDFRWHNMDAIQMLKAESFDSILMLWTFAYTEHPEKLISEINRLLKPNGKFFIITYAEKFRKKHSYILDGTDHKFYLTKTKAKYFTLDFEDVSIEGFRFFDVPRFYNLSIWLIKIFLMIDKFFQDRFQNKCYYLIIKGRKG